MEKFLEELAKIIPDVWKFVKIIILTIIILHVALFAIGIITATILTYIDY